MSSLLLLLSVVALTFANKITYNGYKVFKIFASTDNEEMDLKKFVESNNEYKFWNMRMPGVPPSVMVAPHNVNKFVSEMSSLGLEIKLSIDDLQALIDRQVANRKPNANETFDWTRYHDLNEINDWLDGLEKKYPKIVKTIIAGRSYEGRPIKGVRISFDKNNKDRQTGVFIEAGIHANEWISPATATYLINELLTSKHTATRKLAAALDWYVVPILNPDGYVYTHTTDRMWRKNRSPSNANCTGVDLNRNWDFEWLKIGASNNSCNAMYAGRGPFSEMETSTLSEYISTIGDKLFAYIDFHAFSQLLMVPYGHTKEKLDNYNETYAIGLKTVNALAQRYKTQYKVGNFAETIYPASGSSLDWVKSKLKLPIAFAYELRDKGDYGMLLPPEQIVPNGQEIMDSLIAMFEEAKKYGYPRSQKQ